MGHHDGHTIDEGQTRAQGTGAGWVEAVSDGEFPRVERRHRDLIACTWKNCRQFLLFRSGLDTLSVINIKI
jgi:hypothetical protein